MDTNEQKYQSWGAVKAFLLFGVLAFGLLAVLYVIGTSTPISVYLLGAIPIYFIVRNRKGPVSSATKALLLPVMFGWGLLIVLLVTYNSFGRVSEDSFSTERVRDVEVALLHLSRALPPWTKLAWWKLVALLLIFAGFARALPTGKPVTRFLGLQKHLKLVTGMLATATSFSFFTNDQVIGRLATDAQQHVVAVVSSMKDRKDAEIGRYLASRAVSESLDQLSNADTSYLLGVVRRIESIQSLDGTGREEVYDAIGRRLAGTPERVAEHASAAVGSGHSVVPTSDLDNPKEAIARGTEQLASATALASKEETKAIEKILTTTLSLGTSPLKKGAGSLVSTMIAALAPDALAAFVGTFTEEVTGAMIDRRAEPTVKEYASRVVSVIRSERTRDGESRPAAFAATETVGGVVRELAARRIASLSKEMQEFSASENLKADGIVTSRMEREYRASVALARAEMEFAAPGAAHDARDSGAPSTHVQQLIELRGSLSTIVQQQQVREATERAREAERATERAQERRIEMRPRL